MYGAKCRTFIGHTGVGAGTVISPDCGYSCFSVPYMSHNPALVSEPHTCISVCSAGSGYMTFIQVSGLCY